jgi:hypothetical protein
MSLIRDRLTCWNNFASRSRFPVSLKTRIDEGENGVAAIDANERRHAHEINFIPHPSSTAHQANTNNYGQMLTNKEPQHSTTDII